MSIDELAEAKAKLGLKTDKELADFLGIKAESINMYRVRGIPNKLKLLIEKGITKDIHTKTMDTSEPSKIPIHYYKNVTASAGYGISVLESAPQTLELSEALLNGVKIQSYKHLDLISVAGDSMLPYFENGDKVLIERECVAKNGDTIIANIEDNLYIKRLEKDPFNKWIKLISANKEYATITLEGQEMEKINIIGIVRTKLSVKVY